MLKVEKLQIFCWVEMGREGRSHIYNIYAIQCGKVICLSKSSNLCEEIFWYIKLVQVFFKDHISFFVDWLLKAICILKSLVDKCTVSLEAIYIRTAKWQWVFDLQY